MFRHAVAPLKYESHKQNAFARVQRYRILPKNLPSNDLPTTVIIILIFTSGGERVSYTPPPPMIPLRFVPDHNITVLTFYGRTYLYYSVESICFFFRTRTQHYFRTCGFDSDALQTL